MLQSVNWKNEGENGRQLPSDPGKIKKMAKEINFKKGQN
jgi:hypothetical protein